MTLRCAELRVTATADELGLAARACRRTAMQLAEECGKLQEYEALQYRKQIPNQSTVPACPLMFEMNLQSLAIISQPAARA